MSSRRSKDQIVSQILSVCEGKGAIKTRIVYASNLNFHNAKHYLDLLIKNGLLESGHKNPALYKTTQKGIELMKHLKAIEKLFPISAITADDRSHRARSHRRGSSGRGCSTQGAWPRIP